MSPRATRWLLFVALVLALPVPALGPFSGVVPPIRYGILLGAGGAIAFAEGSAGPIPLLLGLLALNLVVSLAVAGVLAWATARSLRTVASPALRARLTWVLVAAGLVLAASYPIYETGFGRAPTATLLGVLQ